MSYVLRCPNCGVREVTDFGFGGEVSTRPRSRRRSVSSNDYVYFRTQRRRRPARVVVSPLRLPRVVHRRARHPHQRGALGGAAVSRIDARPGERIDRDKPVAFTFDGRARDGARGRHDRLGALRGWRADVLAQLQVPPPARPDVLRRAVPQLPRRGRRRAGRARVRRAAARGHARRAPERDAVAVVRRDARDRPRSAARSRRPASTTRRSSSRGACGRSTSTSCAPRPASAACAAARRTASGRPLPPPPRRRARRRRRRRRARRGRSRRPAPAPTRCSSTRGPSRAGGCSRAARTTARASSPSARRPPASRS